MTDYAGDRPLAAAAMRAAYATAGAVVGSLARVRSLAASGDDAAWFAERRGNWAGHADKPKPWIWIHGASVGEAEIAVAVAHALARRRPGVRLVVSSGTPTGKARVTREARLESRAFPIDFAPFVRRVLEPHAPLLFVAVETEIWPETLRLLAEREVPTAVVNARLSDRSLPRYWRLAPLLVPLVGTIARVCARDEEAAVRWLSIGAQKAVVSVTGNIKFDLATSGEGGQIAPLFTRSESSPLVLAASTHEGEETLVLDAFAGVRARIAGARLLVAPRHPPRATAVYGLARARSLAVATWSEVGVRATAHGGTALWPAGIDVVVLDRMGMLRAAYAASDAAFIGGSAVSGPGGHNLLEAVMAGCPVAAGPHLGNVTDQVELLREHSALELAADVTGLTKFWLDVLENSGVFLDRSSAARSAIQERRGALELSVAALAELVPEVRE